MSLNDEAVRLALLGRADKRAKERTLNVPQSRVQQRKAYDSQVGGSHKARYESEEKVATHGGGFGLAGLVGASPSQLSKALDERKKRKDKEKAMKGGASADMSNTRLVGGMKRAKLLGQQYAKEMAELDDDIKGMRGGAMMRHFYDGLMEGLGMTGGAGLQDDTAYEVAVESGKTQTGGAKHPIQGAEEVGRHSRGEDKSLTEEQVARRVARGGEMKSMAFPDAVRPKSGGAKFSKAELQRHGVEPGACDGGMVSGGMVSGGRRKRNISDATRSRLKSRGDMIREIMREEGVSLPEASRMLKERGM
jgi:hypothetical protein